MNKKYQIKWSEDKTGLEILDETSRYKLSIELATEERMRFYHLTFAWLCKNLETKKLYITGRKIEEYCECVRNHKVDNSMQYMEIGAGLGDFIPKLILESQGKLEKRPIVIDPANYQVMQQMLEESLNFTLPGYIQNRLSTLKKNCEIIRDPSRVNLINNDLRYALMNHPELAGRADIIVDNAGALFYMHPNTCPESLERKLLKSNGSLLKK